MKPAVTFPKLFSLVLIICLSLIVFHSCKKEKTSASITTATLDFTYAGNLYYNDTIKFHCIASSAPGTFLWIFGDGTTSTDSAPSHVYTTVCEDTVILIINNDTAHAVTKELNITPGAGRFGGTWHWTGGYYQLFVQCCPSDDTTYGLNDTTFAITVINDSTIMVWGETLPYNSYYNYFSDVGSLLYISGTTISYKHDTIFFTYCNGDLGGQDYINYHSP